MFLDLIVFFVVVGYVSVDEFCCGVGFCEGWCGVYEGYFLKLECQYCFDVNIYVWWDLYYFLEIVYYQFVQMVWNGILLYIEFVVMLYLFKQKVEVYGNYVDKFDLFVGDLL